MRGMAVSRRVINYPDSFGATRALLSIKPDPRTRQFPSPVTDGDRMHEPWLFCSLVRSRKGIKPDEGRSREYSHVDLTRGDITRLYDSARWCISGCCVSERRAAWLLAIFYLFPSILISGSSPENSLNCCLFRYFDKRKHLTRLVSFITIREFALVSLKDTWDIWHDMQKNRYHFINCSRNCSNFPSC